MRNFWTRTALLQQHTENLPHPTPPTACKGCLESRHLPLGGGRRLTFPSRVA